MIGLFLIGLSSLIYSGVYYRKNRETDYSKKLFYSTLIAGIVLISIALQFDEADTRDELKHALEQNEALTQDIEKLQLEKEGLENEILELESDYERQSLDLESELKDANEKIEEYEEELVLLENQEKEIEDSKEKITSLESDNKELKNKINELESRLTSAQSSTTTSGSTASSSSSSSNSNNTGSSDTTTQTASVYYKNCTEARNAGAAPVYKGDPGYAKHLDRDGDGIGCE